MTFIEDFLSVIIIIVFPLLMMVITLMVTAHYEKMAKHYFEENERLAKRYNRLVKEFELYKHYIEENEKSTQ